MLPLLDLDPRKIRALRGSEHAELKNTLMMTVLSHAGWFVEFRESLDVYRRQGGVSPLYPSERVERVEALVDKLIREAVDSDYSR